MMKLEVEEGIWTLAVATEHEPAIFGAADILSDSDTAPASSLVGASVRSVVELRAITGGLRPRAMLGGQFAPNPGNEITFEVNHSGALSFGGSAACPSLIGGASLVAGLPVEFAQAVLDGLVRVHCGNPLPAGLLRVDRAGHDEVDSSQMVFERAAGVLRCVLGAIVSGSEPSAEEIRRLLRE